MIGFLLQYWWAALAIILLALAYVRFGWAGLVALGGAMAAAFFYKQGGASEKAKRDREIAKSGEVVARKQAEARSSSDADIQKKREKWTRKD